MEKRLKLALGVKIRTARELRGLSQERLGELINRTAESISNIERGKTMPNWETALALCSCLHVRLSDLVADEDLERNPSRVSRELRLAQMIKSIGDDDLKIAESTVEALYRRLHK
jgi:DNA-binding XRE family transcriptional regulator